MKERIPLQIIEGQLVLLSAVECPNLRVSRQIMRFVIDTGSSNSYLSDKDVRMMQIPVKDRSTKEDVNVGGSKFKQVSIPQFTVYLLKEGKGRDYIKIQVTLSALKTTKCSEKKIQTAQTIPSLLGLDFLKEQKAVLYVNVNEEISYIEFDV